MATHHIGFIAVVAILTSFACLEVLILSASAAMVPRVAASHADAAA